MIVNRARSRRVREGTLIDRWLRPLGLLVAIGLATSALGDDQPTPPDFAREIAPILQKSCLRCHAPGTAKGEVSLATGDDLLANDHVIPGKPEESSLLALIRPGTGGKRPKMPKEGTPLSADQVDRIGRWIAGGAEWPSGLVLQERAKADRSWWSLRPLAQTEPKSVAELKAEGCSWGQHPIDRFLLDALQDKGLSPSPPADKSSLIRRVTFDLIGLPPTPEEVEAFLADDSADAYDRVVDRLLASRHYGEQWGRHWLDVVRFGESTGFERNVIIDNAWPFRDYIIRSFNVDKPFDRLTLEHLAGDVLEPVRPEVLVGTTFLVCGPYDNVGNQDAVQSDQIRANTLDDMIRATSETFLGMTVGCARCHDHKFDPILQRDYYSLYTTFAGVSHGSREIASPQQKKDRASQIRPLEEQRDLLTTAIGKMRKEIETRGTAKTVDYEAKWIRPKPQRTGTEEKFAPTSARFVRLVVDGLDTDPQRRTGFNIEEFEIWTAEPQPRNVALQSLGGKAEGASRGAEDFRDAYSASHVNDGRFGDRWVATGSVLRITLPAVEQIDRVFFCSDRGGGAGNNPVATFVGEYHVEVSLNGTTWTKVADSTDRQPISSAHAKKRIYEQEITEAERRLLALYSEQLANAQRLLAAAPALPTWWIGNFAQPSERGKIFLGGDPQKKGDDVVPSSLSVLGDVAKPYALADNAPEGQRRLALAKWLTSLENPLTPRVMVNRLWQHHFGTGLVDTPSDFGMMGGKPSHPELLDWLSRRLLLEGWRMKPIHRLIMTSRAYQQSSQYREDQARVDGSSRLLWRFPPRRLSAEELRDSLLAVSGQLDLRMGGPGFRLYRYLEDNVATYVPLDDPGPETFRRAVYHQGGRASRVDLLSDFDCPDNASSAPSRVATTSPLQALTMLNHAFILKIVDAFAARLVRETGQDQTELQVRRLFLIAYARRPSDGELGACVEFARGQGIRALTRVIVNSNEFLFIR